VQKRQFYTALYHAQIMPRDRTSEFTRFAPTTPMWDDHYAVWDTWRTKYPLMMLIDRPMVRGTIESFSARLEKDGHVRDSFVAGNGRKQGIADQGGNNVDNIIADAYVKGLTGVDWERAYSVLKHNADYERRGNFAQSRSSNRPEFDTDAYRINGWLPSNVNNVSNTLEYAYNDHSIATVASGLGKAADAQKYAARSARWEHLFKTDAESEGFRGFMMSRNTD
jgi:putative alpha-1,2-mannosidase